MQKYETYTDQEWMEIISDYKNSGLSIAKYISDHHLEKDKFYKMKKRYDELHPSTLPIEFVEVIPKTKPSVPIKITKNGFVFEFSKDVDITLFKELLGVMNDI